MDRTSDSRLRCCVGLAAAAAQGCRYWVDFYTAMLRRSGMSATELEAVLAEIRFTSGVVALTDAMGLSQTVDPALLPDLPHRGRPL